MTAALLIAAVILVVLAWFGFRSGPPILFRCSGRCRKGAPDINCPLHGRGGRAHHDEEGSR